MEKVSTRNSNVEESDNCGEGKFKKIFGPDRRLTVIVRRVVMKGAKV